MNLTESVKPISYLKANAASLIRDVSSKGKKFVITQHGEAKAILLDIESYESLQESVALLKMIAQSRESLRKGRVKPLKKSFSRIRKLMVQIPNEKV